MTKTNGNINGQVGNNKLALADPSKFALRQLQKWNLMGTVPEWLLPKLKYVFVTKDPSSKKYIAFLITESDEVLVVGDNTNGLLALDPAKIKIVERPLYHEELSGKGIIEICNMSNSGTVAARTTDGKIFTWGLNTSGELGQGHESPCLGIFPVKGNLKEERVVQHCCSQHDVVCLTSSGRVFGWGGSVYANMNSSLYWYPQVTGFQTSSPIKWIGAACNCFFALTDSLEVYSWGNTASNGHLQGRSISSNAYVPSKVEFPDGVLVTKVSCGLWHILALSADNQLFAWGYHEFGQVGNAKTAGAWFIKPEVIEVDDLVGDILAVDNVSFCKTFDGTIYEWGNIKGKNTVVEPTATKYRSFDEALIANDIRMPALWEKTPPSGYLEIRYDEVLATSKSKTITFLVDGGKVEAWEFAVCRSPVLRQKIETVWKELVADKKPIKIEDVSDQPLFLALMLYLHSDEILTSDDELLDLVRLANYFEVFELGRKAAKRLQGLLSEKNAVDIYEVARECDAMGLVLVALDLISGFFWDVGAKAQKKYSQFLMGQLVGDLQDLKFGPKLKRPCDLV